MRCLQVDNTLNDLLDKGIKVMSPATTRERRRKQAEWDLVAGQVVPDWATTLLERRRLAVESAARHHREFMVQGPQPLGGAAAGEGEPPYRQSEHGGA